MSRLYSYQGDSLASVQEVPVNTTPATLTEWTNDRIYTVGPGAIGNVLARHTRDYSADTVDSQYYQYDHRGNVVAVTNESGGLIHGYEYDAFGNIMYAYNSGAGDPPTDDILFTGKDIDEEIGLYYFNARWYNCEVGRFVSEAGLNPEDEHPYALCENNSINLIDVGGDSFSPIDAFFDGVIFTGNQFGLHPEDWGSDNGDFFNCFAKCLECNNAADPYAAGFAWAAGGAPIPKVMMGEKVKKGASPIGSLYRKWKNRPKWLKKYGNLIKGRPSVWGKMAGVSPVLVEGAWALGVETHCAATCAGNSNSY